ncbi:MAG: Beta-ketoacyl synthase [Enterovirga sp.]|nr:Beta-ketoacyl synthase [Enterovirga sp.]
MRTSERQDVLIVGRSCRLPGAPSVDALWSNLIDGRCSVTEVPDDRWSKRKHGHPRPKEPGKAYTWAAGVLDDIWSFDPSVFGISPREAEQMDPQQRLMLELTWEALEDAGLRRSALAGTDVGVFVGASSPEYTVIRNTDIASGDAYTATGGAVSIISNRISHAFDFQGPSFTVDTACSSSLVALHQAMEALRSGRIDTAIVGGINLLLSPFGFVIFSQASMLSPRGLCRTFDAGADGYVRSEGAVVFVLQTAERAARGDSRAYARIAGSGVNSDGRTNGIALPSRFSQAKLLRQVYSEAGIKPSEVSFVEAHGTGTRVGDPIEAFTIGEVLGKERSERLRIGSIKSNIGHLEPASGLAGMLKAMLALEHDMLPPSLHVEQPNPEIPFDELNLEICTAPTPLPRKNGIRYAGVNSFGFGGTNAHVVIADPPPVPQRAKRRAGTLERFALSGASRDAVRDLARQYCGRLATASPEEVHAVAAAAVHRREMLSERVVVEWDSPRDLGRKLERIADKDDESAGITWGTVKEIDAPVAFVFSGNGGQWPGMGRAAYSTNRAFREGFDEVDALFDGQFGWSVTEALFAPDLEQRLQFTHVAQPLIFAIQIATAQALAAEGIVPSVVLGHSVGEIAAATVSGALSLKDAVKVIHARSAHQELARDTGRMAVVVGSREQVEALLEETTGVEIAAVNSPRTFTVAGPTDAIKTLGGLARKRRMVFRQLDLDYPFHCALIDCVREPLAKDLVGLRTSATQIPFVSTVTGELIDGTSLDAEYWWRNVREPVSFAPAVELAARNGARVFMEIGPRSVLLSAVTETLEPTSLPFSAMGVLEKHDEQQTQDPIRPAAISAFARGAAADLVKLFGPEPIRPVSLPLYQWQRREFRVNPTGEAVGFTLDARWHRLIGARSQRDATEWNAQLDTTALPELGEHVVGGHAILPAAAFIEMALAVARDWFESDTAAILDLDISQPLQLEHDRAKEVRARLSPNSNTLEILSRARLSRSGWTLHATARITQGSTDPIEGALPDTAGEAFDTDTVYRAAEAVGLHYGPEFRLLKSVRRAGDAALVVELEPSAPHGDYRIDPARLDACFHGLFALFIGLKAERRGTAYLPVRFGHVRLARSGALPARALIEVRKSGERSIVSDFTLFDAQGDAIARLDDVRFQAARIQRTATLPERALLIRSILADRPAAATAQAGLSPVDVLAKAAEMGLVGSPDSAGTSEQFLLEGWATSASYEIARAFEPSLAVSQERLAAVPPQTARWMANLFRALELSGLAESTETGWTVAPTSTMPASSVILRTLAEESPNRSAELLLATAVEDAIRSGVSALEDGPLVSSASLESFELGGAAVRAASRLVERLADGTGLLAPSGGAKSVLQVGYGPLSHVLSAVAASGELRLEILETDPRRLERAKLALGTSQGVTLKDSVDALVPGSHAAVVAAETLHRIVGGGQIAKLRDALAPGGLLLAVEPSPSHFRDLTLGLTPGWFDGGAADDFPISPLQDEAGWTLTLESSGFGSVLASPAETGPDTSILLLAERPREDSLAAPLERRIQVTTSASDAGSGLVARLDALLALDGHGMATVGSGPVAGATEPADTVVFLADLPAKGGDARLLQDLCLDLKTCAESCPDKAELWVVTVARGHDEPLADPVAVGLVSFSRTLANEVSGLSIRRLSAAGGLPPDDLPAAMRRLMAAPQAETDFVLDAGGLRVLRIEPFSNDTTSRATGAGAARLEKGQSGGLAGLSWTGIEAPAPADGEVEILVEASGLNFRDVMWAMSLLPDDILEDGFAGPTLGLECAGRVGRVGRNVRRVKAGDRVIAFAPSAFASSVCVPENVVARIPAEVSTEAAATIPVPFLTAYYGLVTLANLKAGETVLIHGAAGGVGLAAVQIAQQRGATVIATAGAREKRELLRVLGVEHVLNSRSSAFADDIRKLFPDGVDVVLNSLFGEAMERGLSTLRPFGRFIELGKRDYVANTRIGLRPFRRNLSYFGVDVDQLLSDRDRASEIFSEVMGLFEQGAFKPLPYRLFPAAETVDAFRLMQQSGHIGKIILTPPERPVAMVDEREFAFDPTRTHLLTGGFGGFGLETARWLVDKGVRHLVLTGRNGPQSPEAQAVVEELRGRGVELRALACDVTDEAALDRMLTQIRKEMPPLGGVMHAAMVLEDSLVANLEADQLARVLNPKVKGAELLDRLTRTDKLDYFVLFSSITTFVGNPGQAAYVAANGYLEGLARARRAAGRPAMAFAWGAIADVGVLARQKGLAEALAKRVGVKAMPAREALDLMVLALARGSDGAGDAVMAIGSLDWSAARRLPALSSPTFAALVREGGAIETSERKSIELRALVGSADPEVLRKQVVEVIVEEIATVLRVPKQDVSLGKRLSEIGLDSLMAIELATALQGRFELDAPPTGSVGALTVPGLADHVITSVSAGPVDDESRVSQALYERHGNGVDVDLGAVTQAMEAVQVQGRVPRPVLQ